MADFSNIKQEINDVIYDNEKGGITSKNLRELEIKIVDSIDGLKLDVISDLEEIRRNSNNAITFEEQNLTDQQRIIALANVSNQTANSTTGKMGYVVLQPEKAGDATTTFAAQIADKPNTIFEIRDVFDLNGENITIPANCTLKFNGGKIINTSDSGGLQLQNTILDCNSTDSAFLNVAITGSCANSEVMASWFGMIPVYTLTTSPNDVLVNTEAQATATTNTNILNNYIIPWLNSISSSKNIILTINNRYWINDQILRIYNFNLNCQSEFYYIGEDNVNGAIIEIGGAYKVHTVKITNNYRHSLLKYPEYATNGSWDVAKAFTARKGFGIIGVMIRDSYHTTINVNNVDHFTKGVVVAGGYGSNNSSNFVSYLTLNINTISNSYKGLVFDYNSGWITECTINKGRIMWQGVGTTPFESRYPESASKPKYSMDESHNYAIVFEDESADSTSNMIFNQPCIETADYGVYIKNMTLTGCEFNNVRDEGVHTKVVEEGTIINATDRKSIYCSYYGANSINTECKTIVIKNTNTTNAATDIIDVDVQAIYGQLDSNNKTFLYSFKDLFIGSLLGRFYDSYYSSGSYGTTISNALYADFHQYGAPAVVFDNSSGSTRFSGTLLFNNESPKSIYVLFFDENNTPITSGITLPQSFYLNNNGFTIGLYAYSKVFDVMFVIPSNVKTIVLSVTNVSHFQFSLTSGQAIKQNKGYFMLPSNPVGSLNCDFKNIVYFNTTLRKFVNHRVGTYYDRWITDDGFDAVSRMGTTANRPTNLDYKENYNNGLSYFDTTLGKNIYYKTKKVTLTLPNSGNCGKNGIKNLGSNNLIQGKKYYVKNAQGGQNDNNTFCFCKASGDLTDSIQIPLINPVSAGSSYYTRETAVFEAPDPSEYPFLAANISSETSDIKFYYLYDINGIWVDEQGYTAALSKGDTASRPTNLTTNDVGFEYFDTDLNKYVIFDGSGWKDSDAIHIATSQPSGGMLPNIQYNFGTLNASVMFSLATPVDATVMNVYYWTFTTPANMSGITVTMPSGITWADGTGPVISAGSYYEIMVCNGIGTYMEV